jgi:hypothetical protein
MWAGCYGNSMHQARRHKVDEFFLPKLRAELAQLAKEHPDGFLVRLHTLGDFYSAGYVLFWGEMLIQHPALHVFGYTSYRSGSADPREAQIGKCVEILRAGMWDRFAVRTSIAGHRPEIATWAVTEKLSEPEPIVCPAQVKATEACASCGLCWAPAARNRAIAFQRHGMKRRAGPVEPDAEPEPDAPPEPADVGPDLAALVRRKPDPMEEARAFKALRDQGLSTADIAGRINATPRFVQLRLKLLEVGDGDPRDAGPKAPPAAAKAKTRFAVTGQLAPRPAQVLAALKKRADPDGTVRFTPADLAADTGVPIGSMFVITENLTLRGLVERLSPPRATPQVWRLLGSAAPAEPEAAPEPPAPVRPKAEAPKVERREPPKREAPPARAPVKPTLPDAAPLKAELKSTDPVVRLKAGECKWPIGDPKAPGFKFCRRKCGTDTYCSEHQDLAVLKGEA